MKDNKDIILGLSQTHLAKVDNFLLHIDVIEPIKKLQILALKNGFNMQIISAYRSFEKQLSIWNAKACGKRKILDDNNEIIDISRLSKEELIFKILRFSALPGTSRHHWGSDFDIYDANKINAKDVQLVESECTGNGPCASMHEWLTELIENNLAFDFFRPYKDDLGGVAKEPWHLSYAPVSNKYFKEYTFELFEKHLESIDIELKETLLKNSKEIYERFVINVSTD